MLFGCGGTSLVAHFIRRTPDAVTSKSAPQPSQMRITLWLVFIMAFRLYGLLHDGHTCFCLCFDSICNVKVLNLFPYLEPNLPVEPTIFVAIVNPKPISRIDYQ